MGPKARREYTIDLRKRYAKASRGERSRLLDEFTTTTGYHRKYAIELLGKAPAEKTPARCSRTSRFTRDVERVLVALWAAAGYPWSRRLIAMLPTWLPWARESLSMNLEVEALINGMSARSIDRMLRPHRIELRRRIYGRTKPGTLLKHQIPIRSERWSVSESGWCEVDLVAHCGDSGFGDFVNSVNSTDVASTWTETRAVIGKSQQFVVGALDEIRKALPFSMRGIDSDSGSEFINYHCIDWCRKHSLDFTRSRPYRKNDNIFGWRRIDNPEAIDLMNDLYRNELCIWLHYFQPSVKLVEKQRVGSRVKRVYDAPQTPLDRLIALQSVDPRLIAEMQTRRAATNPFELAAAIEAKVAAILRVPMLGPGHRPGRRLEGSLSVKHARKHQATKAAPVRNYVAR